MTSTQDEADKAAALAAEDDDPFVYGPLRYSQEEVKDYAHRLLDWLIDSEEAGVLLRQAVDGRLTQMFPQDIDDLLREFDEHEGDRAARARERYEERAREGRS